MIITGGPICSSGAAILSVITQTITNTKDCNILGAITLHKLLMVYLFQSSSVSLLLWIAQKRLTKLFPTNYSLSQEILVVSNKLLIQYSLPLGSTLVPDSTKQKQFQTYLFWKAKRNQSLTFSMFYFSHSFISYSASCAQISAARRTCATTKTRRFLTKVKKDLMNSLR